MVSLLCPLSTKSQPTEVADFSFSGSHEVGHRNDVCRISIRTDSGQNSGFQPLFNASAVKARYNVHKPYKVADLTSNIHFVRGETSLALIIILWTLIIAEFI
jgi:hypothetical protein